MEKPEPKFKKWETATCIIQKPGSNYDHPVFITIAGEVFFCDEKVCSIRYFYEGKPNDLTASVNRFNKL